MKPNKQLILKSIINQRLTVQGWQKKDLAAQLLMSSSSLYNKISKPEMFTLGELRLLFKVLKFTEDEKLLVVN